MIGGAAGVRRTLREATGLEFRFDARAATTPLLKTEKGITIQGDSLYVYFPLYPDRVV
jgi:hypothetical protein